MEAYEVSTFVNSAANDCVDVHYLAHLEVCRIAQAHFLPA